jgi:hypothetical protein
MDCGQVSKRDFKKVSASEVQLSSGATAITSFHFPALGACSRNQEPHVLQK